jgi:hypothetical protein
MTNTARPGIRSVRIERRGGLAGLPASVERSYAALSAKQRAEVDTLATSAARQGSPDAAGARAAPPAGADRFSFRVHLVHADGNSRVIDLPEEAMPPSLAELAKPDLP